MRRDARILLSCAVLGCSIALCPPLTAAQEQEKDEPFDLQRNSETVYRVRDDLGALSDSTTARLERVLGVYESHYDALVRLLVGTSPPQASLAQYGAEFLRQEERFVSFSTAPYMLLFIDPAAEDAAILVRHRLDPASLPDTALQRIITTDVVPALRSGDVDAAALQGTTALLRSAGARELLLRDPDAFERARRSGDGSIPFIIIVLALITFSAFLGLPAIGFGAVSVFMDEGLLRDIVFVVGLLAALFSGMLLATIGLASLGICGMPILYVVLWYRARRWANALPEEDYARWKRVLTTGALAGSIFGGGLGFKGLGGAAKRFIGGGGRFGGGGAGGSFKAALGVGGAGRAPSRARAARGADEGPPGLLVRGLRATWAALHGIRLRHVFAFAGILLLFLPLGYLVVQSAVCGILLLAIGFIVFLLRLRHQGLTLRSYAARRIARVRRRFRRSGRRSRNRD